MPVDSHRGPFSRDVHFMWVYVQYQDLRRLDKGRRREMQSSPHLWALSGTLPAPPACRKNTHEVCTKIIVIYFQLVMFFPVVCHACKVGLGRDHGWSKTTSKR
jgi:hypothetical protein